MEIIQVDSFTDQPFRGNPAAVCILQEARDENWMQQIAAEMNLSETAFLVRNDDGVYNLRWFTPQAEVDLCGHATLASAHVLWEDGHLDLGEAAQFDTRSGRLTAQKHGDWIEMDFPAHTVSLGNPPVGLFDAIGANGTNVGKATHYWLVEVESEETLRNLKPDFSALLKVTTDCVIVTAKSDGPDFDFVSRFFAPFYKINEDPVTGSAHCALGPYWAAKLGRNDLVAYQASERGGVVKVSVSGNRVQLSGQAVTVLRAQLLEPAFV